MCSPCLNMFGMGGIVPDETQTPKKPVVEMPLTAPSLPACHNCGAALQGRFCVACGQKDQPLDPTVRDVVGEFARELSDLDGRILNSIRRLFLSPGFLTAEHFRGRRVAWVSPVRLYLVFSVAYFAIVSMTGVSPLNFNFRVTSDTDAETTQAVQQLGFSSEAELRRSANVALVTWIPRAMFLLLPLFGWFVAVARRKSPHRYPHHLIFSLHLFAAFFGVQALGVGLGYLSRSDVIAAGLGAVSTLFAPVYMVLAMRTVYGGTLARSLAHTALVLTAYWLASIIVTGAIIAPVLFWW
jgi:hypothetical protein